MALLLGLRASEVALASFVVIGDDFPAYQPQLVEAGSRAGRGPFMVEVFTAACFRAMRSSNTPTSVPVCTLGAAEGSVEVGYNTISYGQRMTSKGRPHLDDRHNPQAGVDAKERAGSTAQAAAT